MDSIDSLKYALAASARPQYVLTRVPCKGVGDNDGFYELTVEPTTRPEGT